MHYTPTPAQIDQLRRDAQRLARDCSLTAYQAKDRIAVSRGFSNWSQLINRSGLRTNAARKYPEEADVRSGESFRAQEKANDEPSARDLEGTYRRGFHHGAYEVMYALKRNPRTTLAELEAWVNGPCLEWRNDMPLDVQLVPPEVGQPASSAKRRPQTLADHDFGMVNRKRVTP